MNKPESDIALIRKYRNGDLNPAEKNRVEAMALDNPFLQDALDGFEEIGINDADLLALNDKIDQRTSPQKLLKPVWGIKQWGIAASVLMGIALASIYFNQVPKNKTIALDEIQQKEDIPASEKAKIAVLNQPILTELNPESNLESPVQIRQQPNTDNVTSPFTADTDITVEPLANSQTPERYATATTEARDAEILIAKLSAKRSAKLVDAQNYPPTGNEKKSFLLTLKGKIINQNDSSALPGVSVKNVESGEVIQTDAKGDFAISAVEGANLVVTHLDYETKTTFAKNTDSLKISLKPSRTSLSEMAVESTNTQKPKSDILVAPKVGWQLFKSYLEEQASNAKIGRGKVHIQFLVNPSGELSDFKILNTFSAQAGVASINFIKNYTGGWFQLPNNVPYKTNVTLTFK